MAETIGNPLSWTARNIGATSKHIADATAEIGGEEGLALPRARAITYADLSAALRAGWQDFLASRADAVAAVLIYPAAGLLLIGAAMQMDLLPLLFPLAAGFALLGPVAAVGLYEISRRRERGEEVNWLAAFGVIRSPAFGAILVLGLYLAALFACWMLAAYGIYAVTLGPEPPASAGAFLADVLTTGAGWTMAILGIAVGFLFALAALVASAVSFPLLLHRHVGVPLAVVTSARVFRTSPGPMLAWGAIVAGALVIGSIPVLLGLIIVIPVLGHATWHLYRRAVA
ncbi:DUF2189 domain-containing protein [Pseudooceanicola sp.]|uniref:DUF2189 domain-containing protein n=1 Tax=Pseudooceanicola sp. TaxID=1914328 RepID=UPI0035194098